MIFYLLFACSENSIYKPIEEELPADSDSVDPTHILQNPIAMCTSNPETIAPPFEPGAFTSDGSYDPEGLPITYEWSWLEKPAGSTVDILVPSSANLSIIPDVAGTYTVQLIVTTEDGRVSEPCKTSIQAIPAESLWVELYWEHGGDDLDLHLTYNEADYWDYFGDCFWLNCTYGLEWGTPGIEDNAFLDLDDIEGTGPENINIAHPAPGVYRVGVQDYVQSVYDGENKATVNIYINGNLAWTNTKASTAEGVILDFADIHWPSGNITSL